MGLTVAMPMPPPPGPPPRTASRVPVMIAVGVTVLIVALLAGVAIWWFVGRDAGSAGTVTEDGHRLLVDDRDAPEEQRWLESPYEYRPDAPRPHPVVWPVDDDHALVSPGLIDGAHTTDGSPGTVFLMDLGSGEPLWTAPIGDHCPSEEACEVTAGDLPGTDYVQMNWRVTQDGAPTWWRMALLDRDTGAEVSALEGEGYVTLVSLPSGNSYLMRFSDANDRSRPRTISRVTDDLTEPEWTATVSLGESLNYLPFPQERDGVVYLTANNATVAALRIDDGTPAEGSEGRFVMAGGVRVVESEDRRSVVARREDGTEAWRADLALVNYFTCGDRLYRSEVDPNRLAVLDPATGNAEHVNDMPNPIFQRWCVGDWIISLDSEIAVLDGETGRVLWNPGGVENLAGFGESTALITEREDQSSQLVARELSDGSVRWTVDVPDDGTIRLVGHRLVMWRSDGSFTVLR